MAIGGFGTPVAGTTLTPEARPGSHTMNVIGAIAPLKLVPDMMTRAAVSAVKDTGNAGVILKAGVDGLKGLRPTFGAAFMQALNPMNLFRSLKFGALVSFPLAFIQNFIDMQNGNIDSNKLLVGTVADGIGYTVAGSVGTFVGGLVGSIVPVAGTLIGMLVGGAVGILGSELYDRFLKPDFQKAVAAKMFGGAGEPAAPATVPPVYPAPSAPTPPVFPVR
jgi:hypothetical protein